MNYITVEEFLKQSDKVQNELLGWWKNNLNEISLVGYIGINKYYKNSFPTTSNRIALDCMEIGKEIIPLLQMQQLIQFIEDKTNKKLEIQFIKNNYFVNIVEKYTIEKQYIKLGNNLLEALWKVTMHIIEN